MCSMIMLFAYEYQVAFSNGETMPICIDLPCCSFKAHVAKWSAKPIIFLWNNIQYWNSYNMIAVNHCAIEMLLKRIYIFSFG